VTLEQSLLAFGGLLVASAVYSGCETGMYSLSRVRLDVEADAGRRSARLLRRLLRDDVGLLVTLLIGNNLALELATHEARTSFQHLEGMPPGVLELLTALAVTPLVFFFGEVFPKDLFLRYAHRLLGWCMPLVSLSYIVFLPLALPLRFLSRVLERLFAVSESELARALGREEMREVLRESARVGVLEQEAEELAHNALVLRETPVGRVMVPWAGVRTVDVDLPDEEVRTSAIDSQWTRLPALSGAGGPVLGYLYQLDVLACSEGETARSKLRAIPSLPADLPVDRALSRLRLTGQRLAIVGTPDAPEGLVTLSDLIARISGVSAS